MSPVQTERSGWRPSRRNSTRTLRLLRDIWFAEWLYENSTQTGRKRLARAANRGYTVEDLSKAMVRHARAGGSMHDIRRGRWEA